jgi:serine/threonine protein phosphatase PrpC
LVRPSNEASALAIVCDGIGGHEGGEVASHLAIDSLREQVEKLPSAPDKWNPTSLSQELENAVCVTNDLISRQNDSEHRSDRQRMGTTLVMARTCAHEIYITHVGDSRVYWVTRQNCHQVTQDDDLASREVRLGYALYRNAVQNPAAGSLVQALGMAPSVALHPTVQRFVLDEDCVFLLCSDGLSDNDRVEQYWQTEILPILEGQVDLRTAGTRLLEIANTQNGHDNTTIALVHCQVTRSNESKPTQLPVSQLEAPLTNSAKEVPITVASAVPSRMKTQQLVSPRPARHPWGLLLGIFFLLGIGGALACVFIPDLNDLVMPWIKEISSNIASRAEPPLPNPSTPESPEPSASSVPSLNDQETIQLVSSTIKNPQGKDDQIELRGGFLPEDQRVIGVVPTGSVLKVIRNSPDQQWVQLVVCSPGSSNSTAQKSNPTLTPSQSSPGKGVQSPGVSKPNVASVPRPIKQGAGGWIRKAEVLPIAKPAQSSECAPPAPPPPPTATPSPVQSPTANQ